MATKKTPTYGIVITPDHHAPIVNLCDAEGAKYEVLKQHIPGPIGLMPTRNYNTRYMCYIDDEAIPQALPQNELAAYVLDFLEFNVGACVGSLVLGPVVILGGGDRGLTEEQASVLDEVCAMFDEDPEVDIKKELGEAKLNIIFGQIKTRKLLGVKSPSSSEAEEGEIEEEEVTGLESEIPEEYFSAQVVVNRPPAVEAPQAEKNSQPAQARKSPRPDDLLAEMPSPKKPRLV